MSCADGTFWAFSCATESSSSKYSCTTYPRHIHSFEIIRLKACRSPLVFPLFSHSPWSFCTWLAWGFIKFSHDKHGPKIYTNTEYQHDRFFWCLRFFPGFFLSSIAVIVFHRIPHLFLHIIIISLDLIMCPTIFFML